MSRVTREQFLAAAMNLIGTPYIYGGRGAIENEPGVDCSGLVALSFWNAGDKETARQLAALSAQGMWSTLPPCKMPPEMGDLAFYGLPQQEYKGKWKVTHVVVMTSKTGPIISASGGSSEVDTLQEAHEKDAKVKAFPNVAYRSGCLGFRSLAKYFK